MTSYHGVEYRLVNKNNRNIEMLYVVMPRPPPIYSFPIQRHRLLGQYNKIVHTKSEHRCKDNVVVQSMI